MHLRPSIRVPVISITEYQVPVHARLHKAMRMPGESGDVISHFDLRDKGRQSHRDLLALRPRAGRHNWLQDRTNVTLDGRAVAGRCVHDELL